MYGVCVPVCVCVYVVCYKREGPNLRPPPPPPTPLNLGEFIDFWCSVIH